MLHPLPMENRLYLPCPPDRLLYFGIHMQIRDQPAPAIDPDDHNPRKRICLWKKTIVKTILCLDVILAFALTGRSLAQAQTCTATWTWNRRDGNWNNARK